MGAPGEAAAAAAMINNSMAVGPQPGPHVMVPNYSMYAGTPTYVANMKVRSNVPSFLAENELKLEILKRQHISHAQVSLDLSPRPASSHCIF